MPIKIIENRVFVLHTNHMTYAMYINEQGQLLNTYWGKRILRSEDFSDVHFETEKALHYPPSQDWKEECSSFGNLRFKETSLKVTFEDGTRDFRYRITGWEISNEELTITLQDEQYPMQVQLFYRVYPQYDIIEKWRKVSNIGNEAFTMERCHSAEFSLPGVDYQSVNFAGRWGSEFSLVSNPIGSGKQVYDSLCGLTGHCCNPVFAVHKNANEEHGQVYFGALAYSGNFKIVIENVWGNYLNILAGVNDTDFCWALNNGDSFETPHVYAGCSDGFSEMSHILHKFSRDIVLPQTFAQQELPVLYNSWYATQFAVNVEEQCQLANKAAALGIELFVVDDGWFKGRFTDDCGLGDWTVDKEKFPQGLTELIQHVKKLGMRFGLWIEPEMVNPKSDLYRVHPDWILRYPTRKPTLWRNQYMLNMGNKAVIDYLFNALNKLLAENEITYIKWDMNRYASEIGAFGCDKSEWKSLWHKYVQGFYELIQKLRTNHPNVEFEACASGGGRVDFGAMQYFDEYWTSDNTDPLDRLMMQKNYSLFYPTKCMRAWLTDKFDLNNRTVPLKFAMHCAMCGALGIGNDLNRLDDKTLHEISEYIELYKKNRSIIQLGDLYRLTENCDPLQAVQFQFDTKGVAFIFLTSGQKGQRMYSCHLKGLDAQTVYRCIIGDTVLEKSGDYLMQYGFTLNLCGDYDSVMIQIEAI